MANYQELVQDAVCQSHTGHMTGLWFPPARPLRLNTNERMNHFKMAASYMKHKPDVIKFLRTVNGKISTSNEVTHEQEHFSLRYRNFYFAQAPNLINKERKRLAI